VSVEDNKKVAVADVLSVGPDTLGKKLACYADDAVLWDPVMKVAGYMDSNTASGLEEVKAFFTWLAGLPPVKGEVRSVFGEGDWVAVEWQLVGGGEGKTFEIPCANIYEFKDDKIRGVRMHFDSAHFAEIISGK